ncbi:MAG: class I mannose-6-phosphate isomerase [Lachnospiraceae bacterium]|nr:class I mannose-6-phosphate isomerase [Lachnospiraceae bacterium]
MGILKLKPVGKDYLWGGNRLNEEYGKHIPMSPLAETWECSVHPDGPSMIVEGEHQGKTLDVVLKEHPEYMGTKMSNHGELPILIKFIDAKKDLSVQVHPNDEYARIHENQNGKTEMWYVLDAEPGAYLVYGFEHPVTENILREAVSEGTLDKHLHKQYVKKGDVVFVPAGMVHGIGAGILVAEIQENSNVTYRVYDYNRTDKDGNKRELHFDKAVRVMNMDEVSKNKVEPHMVRYFKGCSRELLCRCEFFETERIAVQSECTFDIDEESFQVILCLDGSGSMNVANDVVGFMKGDCLFLPADSGNCNIMGDTELLKVRC